MLRHEVGDLNFWKGIQQYYATYRNSNALTADFQKIMEEVSGKNLDTFFKQWLFKAGHPKISATWLYDGKTKSIIVELSQTQKGSLIQFPLDIELVASDGKKEIQTIQVLAKSEKFNIPATLVPVNIVLDPNTWLLFEGSITQK